MNPNSEECPAADDLTGGPGRDQFVGSGADRLFARDGVPESSIGGFEPKFGNAAFSGGFAEIDLQDTVLGGLRTCTTISQAPVAETPAVRIASRTVAVAGRTAKVRVACRGDRPCSGKVTLRLARKGAKAVCARSPAKGAKTVSLRLSPADAARVRKAGVAATRHGLREGREGTAHDAAERHAEGLTARQLRDRAHTTGGSG